MLLSIRRQFIFAIITASLGFWRLLIDSSTEIQGHERDSRADHRSTECEPRGTYLISFHHNAAQPEKQEYTDYLASEISTENLDAVVLDEEIVLLIAILTPSQLPQWHWDCVETITPDGKILSDSSFPTLQTSDMTQPAVFTRHANGLVSQESAPLEMSFISQPPDRKIEMLRNYVFRGEAGSGVTVYLQDSGVNFEHEEFRYRPLNGIVRGRYRHLGSRKKNSLWGKMLSRLIETEPDVGHGTCVADKVVGAYYGIAKGASLAVAIHDGAWSSLVNGLSAIIDDVVTEKARRGGNFYPVLCLAYAGLSEIPAYRTLFRRLVEMDVVIVISAGNYRNRSEVVDTYPALYAKDYSNVIVVGAVDNHGQRVWFSQGGPLVKVSAPGIVRCASEDTGYVSDEGTSFAAPVVAGLAAYLLSTLPELRQPGRAAEQTAEHIWKSAYSRGNGPPAVWNGEHSELL